MSSKQHGKRDLLAYRLQSLLMTYLILGVNASDSLEVLKKLSMQKTKTET